MGAEALFACVRYAVHDIHWKGKHTTRTGPAVDIMAHCSGQGC